MRVIMLSTDRNIFISDSPMAKRMISYGKVFGELHVIVFSLEKQGYVPIKLSPEVFVYPTASSNKLMYISDTLRIADAIAKTLYFGQTVISTQDPFEKGIVGLLLRWKTGFPLQMQIHTDLFAKEFYDGQILNWFRFQIAKYTLKKANGIRVVREKIKNDLVRRLFIKPGKIVTLPIFVDIEEIRRKEVVASVKERYPEFSHHIIMISRLSKEKNISLGLKAFATVLETIPGAGLIIVGSGPEEKKLKQLAKTLRIIDKVRFEGWQGDVSSYYKTADVFVSTSDFEGYGLTLVEAASVRCPIVTTPVGIAQDVLRDGTSVLVCRDRSPSCFARAIIKVSLVQIKPVYSVTTIDPIGICENWRAGKEGNFFIFEGLGKGDARPITLENPPKLF